MCQQRFHILYQNNLKKKIKSFGKERHCKMRKQSYFLFWRQICIYNAFVFFYSHNWHHVRMIWYYWSRGPNKKTVSFKFDYFLFHRCKRRFLCIHNTCFGWKIRIKNFNYALLSGGWSDRGCGRSAAYGRGIFLLNAFLLYLWINGVRPSYRCYDQTNNHYKCIGFASLPNI